MKFFIDGKKSVSFVAAIAPYIMPAGMGNFFGATLSNHQSLKPVIPDGVPTPPFTWKDLFIDKKFDAEIYSGAGKTETYNKTAEVLYLGLSNLALTNADGTAVPENDIEFPFQIVLKGYQTWYDKFRSMDVKTDLLETFSQIHAGSILYDVYARATPHCELKKIGEIKTKTEFVDSSFGDKDLRFSHQFMEEDLSRRPEWAGAVSLSGLTAAAKKTGCPFFLRGRGIEMMKKRLQLLSAEE